MSAIELYPNIREIEMSAVGAETVTPHDTTKLGFMSRALWVGVSGNIAVLMSDGTTATFVGVQGLIPIRVQRVNSTNTTATDIVSIY